MKVFQLTFFILLVSLCAKSSTGDYLFKDGFDRENNQDVGQGWHEPLSAELRTYIEDRHLIMQDTSNAFSHVYREFLQGISDVSVKVSLKDISDEVQFHYFRIKLDTLYLDVEGVPYSVTVIQTPNGYANLNCGDGTVIQVDSFHRCAKTLEIVQSQGQVEIYYYPDGSVRPQLPTHVSLVPNMAKRFSRVWLSAWSQNVEDDYKFIIDNYKMTGNQ